MNLFDRIVFIDLETKKRLKEYPFEPSGVPTKESTVSFLGNVYTVEWITWCYDGREIQALVKQHPYTIVL